MDKMRWLNNVAKFIFYNIIFFVISCTSDYTENLGGGYFYMHEGYPLNDIYNEHPSGGRVPATVVSYDYNRKFIIAKQKPRLPQEILYEKDYTYDRGEDAYYYWLIIKKEKRVLGPLALEEFNRLRKEYKVPDKLTLETE